MKSFIFVIIVFAILISCGPSKEEIALEEKRRQDSIEAVISAAKAEAERIAQEKIESALKLEREKIKAEKEAEQKAQQAKLNNPVNFLNYKTSIETGFLSPDRLNVAINNIHPNGRTIANVRFRIIAYAKTDAKLGSHEEIIYDYVRTGEIYNRRVDLKKSTMKHENSKLYF